MCWYRWSETMMCNILDSDNDSDNDDNSINYDDTNNDTVFYNEYNIVRISYAKKEGVCQKPHKI